MDKRSNQVRRDTIKLMYEHGLQHYGGSLSCVDILIALYDYIMSPDDVFLLSKGHCCPPMYVLLREKGFNPKIEHHPHYDPENGIHMTSGSLGHGIGFGIGIALAKKMKGEPGIVFVLLGDGETTEGTFFESLLIIRKLQLCNIKIIIDNNIIQGSDFCYNILENGFIYDKSVKYCDGHNIFDIIKLVLDFSFLFRCETVKGRGVSFMANKAIWHSRIMDEEQYKQALKELS